MPSLSAWTSRLAYLALVGLGATASVGCGAKTGLRVWDFPRDSSIDALDAADVVDVQDVPDVPEACVPGMFTLERRGAEVMFVIDRSNSMALTLDGMSLMNGGDDPRSRWRVLQSALRTALPPFQSALSMGAQFFPIASGDGAPLEVACTAVMGPPEVAPQLNSATPIVSVFDATLPHGGTPTFDALRSTSDYLAARPNRGPARYIVLATDGGPNCNTALDAMTCLCTSRDAMNQPNCTGPGGSFPANCLDLERTLRVISQTLDLRAIPTYVIGIEDRSRPDLTAALDQMAIAGGRPRMTEPRFYNVSSPDTLLGAFRTIQNNITRCAYVTPSRPDDPDGLTLLVDGVPLPRDPSRMNGWDWTDAAFGELTLFGPACDRAIANPNIVVTARVGCRDAGRVMR